MNTLSRTIIPTRMAVRALLVPSRRMMGTATPVNPPKEGERKERDFDAEHPESIEKNPKQYAIQIPPNSNTCFLPAFTAPTQDQSMLWRMKILEMKRLITTLATSPSRIKTLLGVSLSLSHSFCIPFSPSHPPFFSSCLAPSRHLLPLLPTSLAQPSFLALHLELLLIFRLQQDKVVVWLYVN